MYGRLLMKACPQASCCGKGHRGRILLSKLLAALEAEMEGEPHAPHGLGPLSSRELEAIRLIAAGLKIMRLQRN